MKYCPKCGYQNDDSANFCIKCGYNFNQYSNYSNNIYDGTKQSYNNTYDMNRNTNFPGSNLNTFSNRCSKCGSELTEMPIENLVLCKNCGTINQMGPTSISLDDFNKYFPPNNPISLPKNILNEIKLENDEFPTNIFNAHIKFNNIQRMGNGQLIITNKKAHFNIDKYKTTFGFSTIKNIIFNPNEMNKNMLIELNVPNNLPNVPTSIEISSDGNTLNSLFKILNYNKSRNGILLKIKNK